MAVTIPYQDGFLLGRSVNMKNIQLGYLVVDGEANLQPLQANQTESQYSFIRSLQDVCSVLNLPYEYTLKVMAGQIKDELVSILLDRACDRDSFTIVFRALYLQKKQYLPDNAVPSQGKPKEKQESIVTVENTTGLSTEDLVADAVSSLSLTEGEKSLSDNTTDVSTQELVEDAVSSLSLKEGDKSWTDNGTHWVRALEVGNELVTMVTISGNDEERWTKLFTKLREALESHSGSLSTHKFAALSKAAEYIDKKWKSKSYKDFKLDIQYFSYRALERVPGSLTGMLKELEFFMDQCTGWAQLDWRGSGIEARAIKMSRFPAVPCFDGKTKSSIGQSVSYHPSSSHTSKDNICLQPSADSDGEAESFTEIKLSDVEFYIIRATLQPFLEENNDLGTDNNASILSSLALVQYPQATYNMFSTLSKRIQECNDAVVKMQTFLSKRPPMNDSQVEEANRILKSVQGWQIALQDLIYGLDFIVIPSEQEIEDLLSSNPLSIVDTYIKDVTYRLPQGDDLDLLVIGKTGHGKSATGNSILGYRCFEESSHEESVTQHTNIGWADVDGRAIKVVDTPGVCDTSHETMEDSINVGIKSISEAIANCPGGFHALLLVISFGQRMTKEERQAIGLLKCIMGDDIIKTHTVCIITFGDRFQLEEKGTTFADWCRTRSGFLKELFEECNYRCVLFNNKAQDIARKKSQLIRLVNRVDKFKINGLRYTNSLFQFAQAERTKIIEDNKVPEASEEMVRDIQLVLEHLNKMVDNTDRGDQYKEALTTLQDKVDSLNKRVTEVDNGQMGILVDTVFALAQTIHSRMEEIADREKPDSPDKDGACGSQSGDGKGNNCLSPADGVSTGKDECAVVPISSTETVGWGENSVIMKTQASQLQSYLDEKVTPKRDEVTEKVTEKVQQEVKKQGKECFPGCAHVFLANGKVIEMKDLQIGDEVLTIDSDGKLIYDTVYMFGHHDPHAWADFVVLNTSGSKNVSVSAEHMVYCKRAGQDLWVSAQQVQVGDFLCVTDESLYDGSAWHLDEVTEIGKSLKQGLFAPFTMSGCVFVDRTLMSCYIGVLSQAACHAMLWPLRQIYRYSPSTLATINGSSAKQPVPAWANLVLNML